MASEMLLKFRTRSVVARRFMIIFLGTLTEKENRSNGDPSFMLAFVKSQLLRWCFVAFSAIFFHATFSAPICRWTRFNYRAGELLREGFPAHGGNVG